MLSRARTTEFRNNFCGITAGNSGLSKTTYPSVLLHRGNFFYKPTGARIPASAAWPRPVRAIRGIYFSACSTTVMPLPSKQMTRVRLPLRAPNTPKARDWQQQRNSRKTKRVICTQACIGLTPRCRFPVERKQVGPSSQMPEPSHSSKPDMNSDSISAKCQSHLIFNNPLCLTPSLHPELP